MAETNAKGLMTARHINAAGPSFQSRPNRTMRTAQFGRLEALTQTPIISNWRVAPFNGQIFAYTFTGNGPPGIYTVKGFFIPPGTWNPAGPNFCSKAFTFPL